MQFNCEDLIYISGALLTISVGRQLVFRKTFSTELLYKKNSSPRWSNHGGEIHLAVSHISPHEPPLQPNSDWGITGILFFFGLIL